VSCFKLLLPGMSQGLKLFAFPRLSEYHPLITNNFWEEGMVVSVNGAPGQYPWNPLGVAPGTHAFISLVNRVERFNHPEIPVFPIPCAENGQLAVMTGECQHPPDFLDPRRMEKQCSSLRPPQDRTRPRAAEWTAT
jgi:hypothetical protein